MNTGRMRIGLAAAGVFAAAALTAGRASGAVATNELLIDTGGGMQ